MDPPAISRLAAVVATALSEAADTLNDCHRATDTTSTPAAAALDCLSQGLARVLIELEETLQTPCLRAAATKNSWAPIYDAVHTCGTTVDALDAELGPLRAATAVTAAEAGRAFHARLQQPGLSNIVARMKVNSVNLQLALQIVQCVAMTSMPTADRADRAHRFKKLERMIALLGEVLEDADHKDSRAVQVEPITYRLYRSGLEILSTHGSWTRDEVAEPENATAFEDLIAARPESAVSTHLGKRADLHDRLVHLKITPTSFGDRADSAVDIEHYYNMASSLFNRGMTAYRKDQSDSYRVASEYFKRGLERAAPLDAERKQELHLGSMHYHYALCCYDAQDLHEAEVNFRLAAEAHGSNADGRLRCLAQYHLAKVRLKLKYLLSAEVACEKALYQMRWEQSIGEAHDDYYNCLRLLALIYWEKGSRADARSCSDLLPPDHRIGENDFETELAAILDTDLPTSSIADSESERTVQLPITPATSVHAEAIESDPQDGLTTGEKEVVKPFEQMNLEKEIVSRPQPSSSTETEPLTASGRAAALEIIKTRGFGKRSGVNKGLRFAAENGLLDVLQVLLSKPYVADADLNTYKSGLLSSTAESPLILAATRGHLAICQRLLQGGANVDLRIKSKTALDHAIAANELEVCRSLLDFGATYGCACGQEISPLARATEHGHFLIAQLLRARGADINDEAFEITKTQRTALMQAARRNDLRAIRWLLDKGALVDGPKPSISTPLIEAAAGFAFDACALLLRRGANHRLQTNSGLVASRASESWWLNKFIREWPASRNTTPPDYLVTPSD